MSFEFFFKFHFRISIPFQTVTDASKIKNKKKYAAVVLKILCLLPFEMLSIINVFNYFINFLYNSNYYYFNLRVNNKTL